MEHLFLELLQRYVHGPVHSIETVPFGMTNDSRIVVMNQGKYVARIYNRHTKNEERLRFEVELTAYLERCSLSFDVPGFVSCKDVAKYVVLSDGSLGSLTRFIEGEIPDLSRTSDVLSYGRTVGVISYALQQFELNSVDVVCPEIAFHEVYNLHSLANQTNIYEFLTCPPFEIDAEQIAVLQGYYESGLNHAAELNVLPKQMVHHDILVFNLLLDPQSREMSGVLDFDFAAMDLRIWELSICLNHLLQQEDQTLTKVELFLDEYRKYMRLTRAEIQWIPYIMELYYVSLLSIYIGQHLAGRNIASYFHLMLKQLLIRSEWMERNQHEFAELLYSKCL
ncbi:phosphotransferase enzyme family protein [Paenibacillus sp. 2KB_20]|uniref:phosphotransferase enzyme family protein n=1 Tax=Paenibacillus sp. 2KB_20 TaxID=3232977 RepID=UPI003F9A6F45